MPHWLGTLRATDPNHSHRTSRLWQHISNKVVRGRKIGALRPSFGTVGGGGPNLPKQKNHSCKTPCQLSLGRHGCWRGGSVKLATGKSAHTLSWSACGRCTCRFASCARAHRAQYTSPTFTHIFHCVQPSSLIRDPCEYTFLML